MNAVYPEENVHLSTHDSAAKQPSRHKKRRRPELGKNERLQRGVYSVVCSQTRRRGREGGH